MDGEIQAEIVDNGKGIDTALLEHPESIGILSMQERARMLGGKITITRNTGGGTRVSFFVPVERKDELSEGNSL